MQSINTVPSKDENAPHCPKCESEIIRVKQGLYNRDTGKRIRKRLRLNIAWGMLVTWISCSFISLVGGLTEEGQSMWIVPVVMIIFFGGVLGIPGYLILKRLRRTDTGELLLYSCSTCFHRWTEKVDTPIVAELPQVPEPEPIEQDTSQASEQAPVPSDSNTIQMEIIEETVEQDVMSPGDTKTHNTILQVSEAKEEAIEKTPTAPRIPRVRLAYPALPKMANITAVRTLILSFIGSLVGVLLLSGLIPIALNSGMDDLLFAIWFLPAIIAHEVVRNFGPKPSFKGHPVQTVVMWLTISLVSSLGVLPLIDQYDLKTWGPHVFLFISAAILTFSGKSNSNTEMYPYCEECDAFLKPELICAYEITETERILGNLKNDEYTDIADIAAVRRETNVAKLSVHACPECGAGMVTLFLKGELEGNTYSIVSVYSQRRSKDELDELRKMIKV